VIGINTAAGHYLFDEVAFAERLINLLASRNLSTLAAAQAAVSAMTFTAAGFLNVKKVLADLVLGSIAFPDEISADGSRLLTLTQGQLASRDVSSTIT
jgi:hypothetical protein